MKVKLVIGSLLLAAISWFGVSQAHALEFKSGDTVTQVGTTDSSMYVAGATVQISGTVNGSVYCAGQSIEISGTVNGDVLCAGQSITINGTVNGDIHVAGQSVTVGGRVDGDANVFAQNFMLSSSGVIARDVTGFSTYTTLSGSVGRDMVAAATRMTINGTVGRDAEIMDQQLSLSPSAHIVGNLTYTSRQQANVAQGAVISGNTLRKEPVENRAAASIQWSGVFYGLGVLLATGIAALLFAPRFVSATGNEMIRKPWMAVGLGIVGLIAPPFAAGVLMLTVIGIPIAVALLLVWVAGMIIALAFGVYAFGRWLMDMLKWRTGLHDYVALLIGAVVLTLVGLVPVLGPVSVFVAFVYGLGGLNQMAWAALARQHAKGAK